MISVTYRVKKLHSLGKQASVKTISNYVKNLMLEKLDRKQ